MGQSYIHEQRSKTPRTMQMHTHSASHTYTHPSTTQPLTHPTTHTHSLTHTPPTYSLTHPPPTHSLTHHPLTHHPLTHHPLTTHSLTHSDPRPALRCPSLPLHLTEQPSQEAEDGPRAAHPVCGGTAQAEARREQYAQVHGAGSQGEKCGYALL